MRRRGRDPPLPTPSHPPHNVPTQPNSPHPDPGGSPQPSGGDPSPALSGNRLGVCVCVCVSRCPPGALFAEICCRKRGAAGSLLGKGKRHLTSVCAEVKVGVFGQVEVKDGGAVGKWVCGTCGASASPLGRLKGRGAPGNWPERAGKCSESLAASVIQATCVAEVWL